MRKGRFNPARVIFLYFLTLILAGTFLLSLPAATRSGERLHLVDAVFTATSASCVTGLIVVETGGHFSRYGQAVILILIQLGGLGIMSLSTLFFFLLGKKLTGKDQVIIRDTLDRTRIEGVPALLRYVVLITLTFESVGVLVLSRRLVVHYGYSRFRALYYAVFHSVSAFCNAGFSLFPDSMAGFRGDPVFMLTMSLLIFFGGLGFIVLFNLQHYRFWRTNSAKRGRLRLVTRIVLTASLALVALAFLLYGLLEWNNTLAGMSSGERFNCLILHSVTPRTAGFNALPVPQMHSASLFLTMALMLIGASPGSTGGGIKTATFVVLLYTSIALIKGKDRVEIGRRTVPFAVVREAICIFLISLLLIFSLTMVLLATEREMDLGLPSKGLLTKILFEVMSAFGTVGLSTGITSHLSTMGRLMLSLTMLVGRVGPLTIAIMIGRRETKGVVRYPEEPVMVG